MTTTNYVHSVFQERNHSARYDPSSRNEPVQQSDD